MKVASGGTLRPFCANSALPIWPPLCRNTDLHLVFVLLVDGSRIRLDLAHHHDQRIGTGIDRRRAAFIQLLADSHVIQLRSFDDFLGALLGRLAGQRLLHVRIVGAQHVAHFAQALGQQHLFEVLYMGAVENSCVSSVGNCASVYCRMRWLFGFCFWSAAAHDQARITRARSPRKPPMLIQVEQRLVDLLLHVDGFSDLRPGVAELLLALRIGADELLQTLLVGSLAGHQLLVLQAAFDIR